MVNIKDIFMVVVIFALFLYVIITPIMTYQFNKIKSNWPAYRCNPMVMPFAARFGHDEEENFTYCVQNAQTNYMSYLLAPTNYATKVLGQGFDGIMNDINFVRMKIMNLVGNISGIIGSILSVFMNILIHFQVMIIKLKDTLGKIVGVVMSITYLILGARDSGFAIINGPIGKTISKLEKI